MKKKTINLNIRISPDIKAKAARLAVEKNMTLTDLIESYIISDYAVRSLLSTQEGETDDTVRN